MNISIFYISDSIVISQHKAPCICEKNQLGDEKFI